MPRHPYREECRVPRQASETRDGQASPSRILQSVTGLFSGSLTVSSPLSIASPLYIPVDIHSTVQPGRKTALDLPPHLHPCDRLASPVACRYTSPQEAPKRRPEPSPKRLDNRTIMLDSHSHSMSADVDVVGSRALWRTTVFAMHLRARRFSPADTHLVLTIIDYSSWR